MNSWSEKSSIACNGFLLNTYIRINYRACTIYNNLGTLTYIHPTIPQPARPLNTPSWMSPKPFGFRDFTINFPSLDLPCTTLYFGLPHPGQARRGGVLRGGGSSRERKWSKEGATWRAAVAPGQDDSSRGIWHVAPWILRQLERLLPPMPAHAWIIVHDSKPPPPFLPFPLYVGR